jgi:hypothetical protein
LLPKTLVFLEKKEKKMFIEFFLVKSTAFLEKKNGKPCLLMHAMSAFVATLALGLQPRQRGYKVVGQEGARESRQRGHKGAGQEEVRESHHILPGV